MMSKRLQNKSDVLSASDIAQYAYCSVSWYLQRCECDLDSTHLEKGARKHIKAGEKVAHVQTKERAAKREWGIRKHAEMGEKVALVQTKERWARRLKYLGYLMLAIVALFLLWWLL
jgi:hypothetical protein